MRLDVSDWLGRHIFVTGEYEPATTAVVAKLLRPGDTFVDVGANAGYFTLLASKLVGPTGKVYSFEPLPDVHRQLLDNIKLNGFSNCVAYNCALSNSAATAEFYQGPRDHTGISSIRKLSGEEQKITVDLQRLDKILASDERVTFCKIDVEGAECHVIEGMTEILKRCRPDFILEITPDFLAGLDRSPMDIDRLLSNNGYHIYVIEHRGLKLVGSLNDLRSQANVFCTTKAITADVSR